MKIFNSSKNTRRTFNSILAGVFDDIPMDTPQVPDNAVRQEKKVGPLKLRFFNQFASFDQDPMKRGLDKGAQIAARHYLYGCHYNCNHAEGRCQIDDSCDRNNCIGGYKDQGLDKPTQEAINTFGLIKPRIGRGRGNWMYSGDCSRRQLKDLGIHDGSNTSKLANLPTLSSYLNIKLKPAGRDADENKVRNLNADYYFSNPNTIVRWGKNPDGTKNPNKPIAIGQYYDENKKPQMAYPDVTIGGIHHLRRVAADNLLNRGITDTKTWWDTMKPISHFAHNDHNDPNQPGVAAHKEIEGVFSSIFDPKNTYVKNPTEQTNYNNARTASFVLSNHPALILNKNSHPSDSWIDVQNHHAAATSKDEAIKRAYFRGFPSRYSPMLDDRMSNLGPRGKLDPLRNDWPKPHTQLWAERAVQGRRDQEDSLFAGHADIIPENVPDISIGDITEHGYEPGLA
jgi:hypothetical protein